MPSPCAVTIGMRLPSMPAKRIEGDFWISTRVSRASYCSDRLRSKCGQFCAPGMIEVRLPIIWQPLHEPSANESGRLKNASNSARARALKRIDLAHPSPAPSTSP